MVTGHQVSFCEVTATILNSKSFILHNSLVCISYLSLCLHVIIGYAIHASTSQQVPPGAACHQDNTDHSLDQPSPVPPLINKYISNLRTYHAHLNHPTDYHHDVSKYIQLSLHKHATGFNDEEEHDEDESNDEEEYDEEGEYEIYQRKIGY